jgi:hypothetical protein
METHKVFAFDSDTGKYAEYVFPTYEEARVAYNTFKAIEEKVMLLTSYMGATISADLLNLKGNKCLHH